MIAAGFESPAVREGSPVEPYSEELAVIMNTVIWFLEKLALRGELTWSNKNVPLEEQLRIFEDLILGYFDRLIKAHNSQKKSSGPDTTCARKGCQRSGTPVG